MGGTFLDGKIPGEYLYDNPEGERTIAPSIDKIRENTPWLAEQDGWIVWEWEGPQKVPHRGAHPRKRTEWQKPGAQASLADAWATYQEHDHIHGVGFVFNGTEPEILEDFDNCINPWAFTVSDPCLEDALENDDEPAFFSSSGTGAHRYPVAEAAEDTSQHPHEVYIGDGGNNRWAAVTGWKITGDTHGPDRSERVNELSEEYNDAEAKTADLREFDFDADPEDVDADAPVPEAIREAFDGDVPACVAGLVHVLGTHDPTDPDGPGWGQQTFMRYSHLLMLLAAHLDADPERLAELVASFRSPAIEATQRGGHPKKPAQATPYGEGVPWDLDYQANKIARKVGDGDLSPPSLGTIADHCNVRIDCDCAIHGTGQHRPVLPPVTAWDWEAAGRRAAGRDPEPDTTRTIDDVRDDTADAIAGFLQGGKDALADVLPTGGKTYGVIAAAARRDTPPVSVFTTRGREEQYAQIDEWAEGRGLDAKTLPSFFEECPTAAGAHGDEWERRVMGWYNRGATGQDIHAHAEDVLGRPLPCQVAGNGERHDCAYTSAWRFDPAEYDVLLGHYTHAHNPKVTAGRGVVVDEFPGNAYEQVLGGNIEAAVTQFLQRRPDVPFEDYTDLLEHRDDTDRWTDAVDALEGDLDTDGRAVLEDDDAHAAAPLATWTLLVGATENLGNGLESVAFPEDPRVGIHNREDGTVRVLTPPRLDAARAVVALDGTPTPELWDLALGRDLYHFEVLDDDERAAYLRDALGLKIVRTTEAVKPYNSADHVATGQDAALLEEIADHHGEKPGLITTATALKEYQEAGVLDVDPDTGAAESGPADRVRWYGNVLGSNEFGEKRVGAVVGSNHYGDHFIKRWAAFAGQGAQRGDGKGSDLSYGPFGDKVLAHMREHDTLQAAMRFGRDGDGATVYVHTDTLPEWVPIAGEGRVIRTRSAGERSVLDAVEGWRNWATADVVEHDAVDLTPQRVREILTDLVDRGYLTRYKDPEDGRATRWADDGLGELGDHGDVDLGGDPDADFPKLPRNESLYTWEFRKISAPDPSHRPPPAPAEDSAVVTPDGGVEIGGEPPDPGRRSDR